MKFRNIKECYINFTRRGRSPCIISKSESHGKDSTVYGIIVPGAILLRCRHCDGQIVVPCDEMREKVAPFIAGSPKKLSAAERKKIQLLKLERKCERKSTEGKLTCEIKYVYENTEPNIYGDYMNPYCADGILPRTLFVKAGMGIGKTQELKRTLHSLLEENLSILALSSRQTLAIALAECLGLTNYKKIKGKIDPAETPRLILQVESLHKLITIGGKKYNVLILDEIESLMKQMFSRTHKHPRRCWAIYCYLITHCDYVICMDAHISQETINFIESLRGGGTLHINQTIRAKTTHYVSMEKAAVDNKLLELIDGGARVFIPVTSLDDAKAHADLIREKFPEKIVTLYTSETLTEVRERDFADINTALIATDVLIYTPTLTAGVSFTLDRFTHGVCYWYDCAADYLSCIQMFGRIRNVRSKTYIHYIKESGQKLVDTPEEIFDLVKKGMYNDQINKIPEFDMKINANGETEYEMNNRLIVCLKITAWKNYSANNFADLFINELKLMGGEVIPLHKLVQPEPDVTPKNITNVTKELKSIFTKIKDDDLKSMVKAREIDSIEFKKMLFSNLLKEDVYVIKKFVFRDIYNYDGIITEQILRIYGSNKMKSAYKNLKQITNGGQTASENLEIMRRYENNNIKQAEYIYDVENLKESTKNYRHEYCIGFLEMFGLNFGSGVTLKRSEVLQILVQNHNRIIETSKHVCYVMNVRNARLPAKIELEGIPGEAVEDIARRKATESKYLQDMLKYINGKLDKQYGVSVRTIDSNNQRDTYRLHSRLADIFDEHGNFKIT